MNQQYNYQQELANERSLREQAEYDSIVNGLAAANRDVEAAKSAYVQARYANDPLAEANAQERIADARPRIRTLEGGKEAMDLQRQYPSQPPPQQQQQYATAMDVINAMTGLSAKEREWLIDHQDLVMTQAGQERLKGAYHDSVAFGIERDSDKYFDLFDQRFGAGSNGGHQGSVRTLTSPRKQYVVGGQRVQDQYKSPSKPYMPQTPKVNLTREEAAKIRGVDMETYRQFELERDRRKKLGMYQDR